MVFSMGNRTMGSHHDTTATPGVVVALGGIPERIPTSVRQLDAVCNTRIAGAQTVDTLNAELRRKQYLKRLLVDLPPADLEVYALAQLAVLERAPGLR
jgi:hypothetical protein